MVCPPIPHNAKKNLDSPSKNNAWKTKLFQTSSQGHTDASAANESNIYTGFCNLFNTTIHRNLPRLARRIPFGTTRG
jgi:hypothetical protein